MAAAQTSYYPNSTLPQRRKLGLSSKNETTLGLDARVRGADCCGYAANALPYRGRQLILARRASESHRRYGTAAGKDAEICTPFSHRVFHVSAETCAMRRTAACLVSRAASSPAGRAARPTWAWSRPKEGFRTSTSLIYPVCELTPSGQAPTALGSAKNVILRPEFLAIGRFTAPALSLLRSSCGRSHRKEWILLTPCH